MAFHTARAGRRPQAFPGTTAGLGALLSRPRPIYVELPVGAEDRNHDTRGPAGDSPPNSRPAGCSCTSCSRHAGPEDLRRRSAGTRWTNEQLLFHMVFGFLVVRTLLPLVRLMGRLPAPVGTGFAALLDSARRPFHVVNYWGSRVGARVFDATRMGRLCDRVVGRTLAVRWTDGPSASLRTGNALPDQLGPLLHSVHDAGRGVPLPDSALRAPSASADPPRRWRERIGMAAR